MPLEVEARFDRERHTWLENQRIARHHVRRLMGFQADTVPGAMDEQFTQTVASQHITGGGIDALARHPRTRMQGCRLLRFLETCVGIDKRIGSLPQHVGASAVTAIPTWHGAANVDNYAIA